MAGAGGAIEREESSGASLEGRVAVVTGGSRGLGREIARAFARHGARAGAVIEIDGGAARAPA